MKLPGQQVKQIQDALLAAFSSWSDLQIMVRIGLDKNLEEIVPVKASLRDVAFGLIIWAEETNQIDRLLASAAEQNSGNVLLADARKAYLQWRQGATAAASEPSLRDPDTIFSEAYGAEVRGELVKALVLYQMIQSEPSLAVAVRQRMRAVEHEMTQPYVSPDGNVSNQRLMSMPHPAMAAQPDTLSQTRTLRSRKWLTCAIIALGIAILGAFLLALWWSQRFPAHPLACVAYQETGGTVVIEAEHFTSQEQGRAHSSGWEVRSGMDSEWRAAPGLPGMMQALEDNEQRNTMAESNGPALLYPIDFQTPGTYYVYVRGFGVNSDGDSIHVGLDGTPVTTVIENGYGIPEDSRPLWASRDGDGNPVTIDVTPGRHTFYIWMRENGVVLDKLWLDTGADKVKNRAALPDLPESPCVPQWRFWFK